MAAARHQGTRNKYAPYTLRQRRETPVELQHQDSMNQQPFSQLKTQSTAEVGYRGQKNYSSTMTSKNTEAAGRRQRCQNSKLSGQRGHVSPPFMTEPMPFIVTAEDGKMKVNEDIEEILVQAEEPISVIAIVGKYRTGKSYIMNRFFSENAGFSLGATVQSKTKGIWIWARPHPLDPSRTLVLLDTEGLLDVEKGDKTHDLQIFSLAVLLSKCFVYNAVGSLDDSMIQQLNLVTELTEHIKTRGNDDDENEFSSYFPAFFLLLRDFFLDIEIDGENCTSDEYLENALKLKPGSSMKVIGYNAPRQCIRNYFSERRCFTLCKPVYQDAMLKMLDIIDEKDINPMFLQEAKVATDAILKKATPMTVDGNLINGMRFLYLANLYVKCINDGAVPCISNAVDLLRDNECQRYLEEALGLFHELMREKLDGQQPADSDILLQYQKEAYREAVACYHKGALFDKDGQYQQKLMSQLEECYQSYITENNSASKKKCEEVLQSCFRVITAKLKSGEYFGKRGAYKAYMKDKETAVRAYIGTPRKGPMADECLHVFLESKKGEEESIITGDKALSKKDKEVAKEKEEKNRQKQKTRQAQARNKQIEIDLHRKEEEHKAMVQKLEDDFKIMQANALKEKEVEMKRKEAECQRLLQEGQMQQALVFQNIINGMRVQNERQHAESMEMQRRITKLERENDGCVIQ